MTNNSEGPQVDPEVSLKSTLQIEQTQAIERQKMQVDATVEFAKYLTSRYPQVDHRRRISVELDNGVRVESPELPEGVWVEPQLNYYLAGSLAAALLSSAEMIELCEETDGSDIRVIRTLANPLSTRNALAKYARPIGDIDYVPTAHYKALQNQVQGSHAQVTNEEYQQSRAKYLWKGGGGPKFGEVPANATQALIRRENQDDGCGVMCDPVESYGTNRFARINIEGQHYYVASPDSILGFKILHMLQSYDQKPDKFNADFSALFQAISDLYSKEELIQHTHQILGLFEESLVRASAAFNKPHVSKLPRMVKELLGRSDLGHEARVFVQLIVAYDQSHGQLFGNQTTTSSGQISERNVDL